MNLGHDLDRRCHVLAMKLSAAANGNMDAELIVALAGECRVVARLLDARREAPEPAGRPYRDGE